MKPLKDARMQHSEFYFLDDERIFYENGVQAVGKKEKENVREI